MRLNTRPGRRLAGGAGVIAALALGLAGVTSTALPSNAVQPGSATNDPTSVNEPGAGNASEFPGYNGYVDPDKADAVASSEPPTTRPASRPTRPWASRAATTTPTSRVPDLGPRSPTATRLSSTTPTDPSPSAVADVTEALDARGTARVIVMTDARQRLEGDLGQVRRLGAALGDRGVARRPAGRPCAAPARPRCQELTSVPSAVYEVTDDGPRRAAGRPGRGVGRPRRQVEADARLQHRRHRLRPAQHGRRPRQQLRRQHRRRLPGRRSSTPASTTSTTPSPAGSSARPASSPTPRCPGGTNALDRRRRGGDECTHSTDCDHGTHVGGIAAGSVFTGGHEGVARGAGSSPSRSPRTTRPAPGGRRSSRRSTSALQHVLNLQERHQPEHRGGQPEHRHATAFTAGDPACNAVNPSTRRAVRPAAGSGRRGRRRRRQQRRRTTR